MLVFVTAGEESGDRLAARLMAALRILGGGRIRFAGVGGAAMAAEGLDSLFPMSDLSVMGFGEVLPRLPLLLRRIRETRARIRELRPAVVVTVDSPGFSFRLLRPLAGEGIPLVHYVAPSVWAWAPGRARKIARFLDHVLALLPFEPPHFEAVGLPCTWVGHPVAEDTAPGDAAAFRARNGIPGDAPLIAVLPGSREAEVRRLLPVFRDAVALLASDAPALRTVIPTVPAVVDRVRAAAADWPVPATVVTGGEARAEAFAASRAALAASGTVSVELAAASVPHVVGYRVGLVSALIVGSLLRVPWVSIVNLLAGREVVPEFLQYRCRPRALATALAPLLADGAARDAQLGGLAGAVALLDPGDEAPSVRAARVVLGMIGDTEAQGAGHGD